MRSAHHVAPGPQTAPGRGSGRWDTGDPWAAPNRPAPRRPHAAHSIRLGRLFGIPLELHWSFLVLIGLVLASTLGAGATTVAAGLVWVGALFACVVVHELAHCLVARRRGGSVLGILLLPIGGMSRMARLPSDPRDESAVAIAGPATSLGLGLLFLALGALAFGSSVWPPGLVSGSWLARLGWLNLFLGVFNLLPALPMDGGRVLRATLARRLPRVRATAIAANVAKVLAVGLVAAGVAFDLWLVVIGVFVYLGASSEAAQARFEDERARTQRLGATGFRWWGPPPGWAPPQDGTPPAPDGTPPAGWPPAGGWPPPAWPPPAAWPAPPGWSRVGPPSRRVPERDAPARAREGRGSAIDVAVEGGGTESGVSEPRGEGFGQHH